MGIITAAVNWSHVAVRAAGYGTVSCILGPVDRRASQWAMRQWCEGTCDGLGIRRGLVHGERLDPSRQCVYIANHLSQLDILVLGSFLEADYRWLSKDAIFKIPFLGWHLKIAGHVPVYRGERKHLNRSLPDRLHDVVQQGASLLFFPEGTRSQTGWLQPFKLGAFHAAVDEQLPIVPLVVRGTNRLLEKGARDLDIRQDRRCSVTVLPELPPTRPAGDGPEARRTAAIDLCERSVRAVAEELGEPVPGVVTDERPSARAEPR